jgi:3'(2'), 5'-bisphosphate nucleotidase
MTDDAELAWSLAHEAGALLLALRESAAHEGKALGKAGDVASNAYIMERLRAERPHDALLSEEENDTQTRLQHRRVWIIDPLDGTREYSEGRDDWAVHIGLSINGLPALGVVALPARGKILSSHKRISCAEVPNAPLRMVISRSRASMEVLAVAEKRKAELIPMGSAGAKAGAVILGEAEIYLHTGGQYEWDNCAPAAVALGQGLHISRADGAPLVYNQADSYLPDLLICRKDLAQTVLHAYQEVIRSGI